MMFARPGETESHQVGLPRLRRLRLKAKAEEGFLLSGPTASPALLSR